MRRHHTSNRPKRTKSRKMRGGGNGPILSYSAPGCPARQSGNHVFRETQPSPAHGVNLFGRRLCHDLFGNLLSEERPAAGIRTTRTEFTAIY